MNILKLHIDFPSRCPSLVSHFLSSSSLVVFVLSLPSSFFSSSSTSFSPSPFHSSLSPSHQNFLSSSFLLYFSSCSCLFILSRQRLLLHLSIPFPFSYLSFFLPAVSSPPFSSPNHLLFSLFNSFSPLLTQPPVHPKLPSSLPITLSTASSAPLLHP